MKKLIVVFMAVLFISSFISNAFAFKNEPDNFRGIKWGTSIKDVANEMQVFEEDGNGNQKFYYRKTINYILETPHSLLFTTLFTKENSLG